MAALLGVIVLAACGAVSKLPTSTALTAAVPRTAGLTAFAGPCRLAVTWGETSSTRPPAGGGFVSFPGAAFAADPTAHTTSPGYLTYSPTSKFWLPATSQFASPDGTKWLYFTLGLGTVMTLTDVATGQSTNLDNAQRNWNPVGIDDSAAYAASEDRSGLWRFPFTGAPGTQLISGGYWAAISPGAAWGFANQSVPAGAPTVLRRRDLNTGSVTDFARFTDPVTIVGLDGAGLPVLSTGQGGTLLALTASGDEIQIATGFTLVTWPEAGSPPLFSVVGDSHGLWIGGADGIYLYQNGNLDKVSDIIASPSGGCA